MMQGSLQTLAMLTAGTGGIIQEINLPAPDRSRLMELGLLVGTPVELVRQAPSGDPVEIKLRGYHLALPLHEAEHIRIRLQSASS
jgi:ferrous iron transport protein A